MLLSSFDFASTSQNFATTIFVFCWNQHFCFPTPAFSAASNTIDATIAIDVATWGGAAVGRNDIVVGAEEPPYLQHEVVVWIWGIRCEILENEFWEDF